MISFLKTLYNGDNKEDYEAKKIQLDKERNDFDEIKTNQEKKMSRMQETNKELISTIDKLQVKNDELTSKLEITLSEKNEYEKKEIQFEQEKKEVIEKIKKLKEIMMKKKTQFEQEKKEFDEMKIQFEQEKKESYDTIEKIKKIKEDMMSTNTPNVPKALRTKILESQDGKCANKPNSKIRNMRGYECPLYKNGGDGKMEIKLNGNPLGDCDHITPKAINGSNDEWNLHYLCKSCHGYKTDIDNAECIELKKLNGIPGMNNLKTYDSINEENMKLRRVYTNLRKGLDDADNKILNLSLENSKLMADKEALIDENEGLKVKLIPYIGKM
jgi:hypothetical protein